MFRSLTNHEGVRGIRQLRSVVTTVATLWPLLLPVVAPATPSANSPNLAANTQAETLIRQGQLDRGIALLTRSLVHNPHNVQTHNLLGIALTGKGELPAANQEYQKALQVQPNFVPALKNLAINELALNEATYALRHFEAALKLAPNDPVLHAYLGKIAYSRRDYRGAAEHLAKTGALVQDPSVASELIESDLQLEETQKAREVLEQLEPSKIAPQWQFRLGLVLAQHELFQEAVPFFRNAGGGVPESYNAGFNLAICYVETKQFLLAIEVLRKLIDQVPNRTELHALLAEAYEGNHQTQEAIDTLRAATQLAPEDENNFVNLTALCTKYEAYDIGMQVLQTGLHYHPQSDRLIFQRGVMYALTGQFELAEKDFQLAGRLAPEKNLSYAALSVSYMEAGDPVKAIASLRQRVAEKPRDPMLQYLLGKALLNSGAMPGVPEFAEAKAALEKSLELDVKSCDTQVELAKVYLKENRVDDALRHLEQARTINSKNTAVYLQLVIAYRRKGKPELASAMLANLNQLNEEEGKKTPDRHRLRIVKEETPPEEDKP